MQRRLLAWLRTPNAMIRRSRHSGGSCGRSSFTATSAASTSYVTLGSSLGAGRHRGDRFQNLRSDLVGVALRVRTAIFQIPLVAIVDEGMRHADRGATISHAVAELVPGRRLVLAGQALVIVRTIDGNVIHQ